MSTPGMGIWTEHRNPEGRTYWFNTSTKQSVWEKPDDLKTPFERALGTQTKWKEYFSGGRKYYYNTETKESKWDMPDELLLLLEKVEQEQSSSTAATRGLAAPTATPTPVAGAIQGGITPVGGVNPSSSTPQPTQNGAALAVGMHTGPLPLSANSVLPARPNLPDDPVIPHNGFATLEEGEKAFTHLLRKAGVDATWTWDQTMRAIITDPLYKALNSLAEKKACWEKYTAALKQKEQEEKEARLNKLRPAIRNMLKGNPNVFHYTTFPTADKLFAQHPIWQQAKIESERKLIFEEYVNELKDREVAETRAARAQAVSKVVAMFKQLNVGVLTRWRQAHELITDTDEWQQDAELRKLPTLDILLAFEDYSRVCEREYEEQQRRMQVEKARTERKAREAFKELLHELVDSGAIMARTKWKEVYPSFKNDERYLNMFGKPGSNPLELFWDVVDELDQKLDKRIVIVEDAIQRYNKRRAEQIPKEPGEDTMDVVSVTFAVTPETTWDQFSAVVNSEPDTGVQSLSQKEQEAIFQALHQDALKKQAEEKRRAERRQRHLQDDLRYALKKLPDPIDVNMQYEEVVPLIQELPEYKALEDEGRRAAFAKYIKRQKEKMRDTNSDDGGSTTSRKRKEPTRDHDDRPHKERERERDRSSHRDRERDRDGHRERDRVKDYDRDRDRDRGSGRSGRHRYDDYDDRRSGRDYDRDKDRDGYRSSKYHRDDDRRKDREPVKDKERRGSRGEIPSRGHEWEEGRRGDRERSGSFYREETREKRDYAAEELYGERERSEKRARYYRDDEAMDVDKTEKKPTQRAETPEEGEI